jgi:hypothetical protein
MPRKVQTSHCRSDAWSSEKQHELTIGNRDRHPRQVQSHRHRASRQAARRREQHGGRASRQRRPAAAFSKEGVNRAERGGKDDGGQYGPEATSSITDPVVNTAQSGGEGLASGAQKGGSSIMSGAKGATGYVGGLTKGWGGKKEEAPADTSAEQK